MLQLCCKHNNGRNSIPRTRVTIVEPPILHSSAKLIISYIKIAIYLTCVIRTLLGTVFVSPRGPLRKYLHIRYNRVNVCVFFYTGVWAEVLVLHVLRGWIPLYWHNCLHFRIQLSESEFILVWVFSIVNSAGDFFAMCFFHVLYTAMFLYVTWLNCRSKVTIKDALFPQGVEAINSFCTSAQCSAPAGRHWSAPTTTQQKKYWFWPWNYGKWKK
jgi:hypothetical protein